MERIFFLLVKRIKLLTFKIFQDFLLFVHVIEIIGLSSITLAWLGR